MTEATTSARHVRTDPTVGNLSAVDATHDAPAARPRRSHTGAAMVGLAAVGVLASSALLWHAWRSPQRSEAPVEQPGLTAATPPRATTPAPAEPVIEHPIDEAQAAADAVDETPLPPLSQSDPVMRDTLGSLFGSAALGRVFRTDNIVHRFVATIDSLPRTPVSLHFSPVNPIGGSFHTWGRGDKRVIAADNSARYTPYVRMVEAIDSKRLASFYIHSYPLFQSAYRDLGYPKAYFNDRVVQAIDDLLAAPQIEGPIYVVQPKVLYEFADPELESRSVGQKMMMRMGSANAARVKVKLRELRRELTRAH